MRKNFKNHNGRHALSFVEDTEPKSVTLGDVEVGDVFMREGAICMRVLDTVINQHFKGELSAKDMVIIINLQTTNVWPAKKTDEVFFIDAELLIKKVHKLGY